MSGVHFHLLSNHTPIIGTFIGLALLIYAIGAKKEEVKLASLVLLLLVALLAIPVYRTGESAEVAVEELPGVDHVILEEHEEAAVPALVLIETTGALALLGLLLRRHRLGRGISIAVAAAALIALALVGRTAFLGGQIRHSEIRVSSPAGE
jgi:Ca2+/Na+ antiporter